MKKILLSITCVVLLIIISGCATFHKSGAGNSLGFQGNNMATQERMLIWRAWLTVEVSNVNDAISEVTALAKQSGGYIEKQYDSGEKRANITLRIPIKSFNPVMTSLEGIGTITSKELSSKDVTEQYIDIDARLKTKKALRDRLRALLNKAQNIKDVLAIEKELTRVQGDIDSMQAKLKALKGKVDFTFINITLKRRKILGPLGYMFKGIFWTIEKLFVIQQ